MDIDIFRISLTLACPMDLRLYPLDKQVCVLQIASCKYLYYFLLLIFENYNYGQDFFLFLVKFTRKQIEAVNWQLLFVSMFKCIHAVWKLVRNKKSKSKVVIIVLIYTKTTVYLPKSSTLAKKLENIQIIRKWIVKRIFKNPDKFLNQVLTENNFSLELNIIIIIHFLQNQDSDSVTLIYRANCKIN